ncbi:MULTISPECIES: DUF4397 domain-containing protein [unclassified Alcanivorax]|uniref:DUF4397 domain-containing protein n=2 Tax=Alcanivorax TaxID=59753 RepID=UPI000AAD17F9|nr:MULTISPECIES: DUF4397 domain-containing protein [unclassified Alcanivorax]
MRMIGMLAVASAVVLSGCGGDDDDVEDLLRPPASLYFHNQLTDFTDPDAASIRVDVITNKASDPLFEDVGYSTDEQSGMNLKLAADTETVDFQVRNADGDMLDREIALKAGSNYTLVQMGDVSGASSALKLESFLQQTPSVQSSKVGVRFIHAMYQQADTTFSIGTIPGLQYGKATAYFSDTPNGSSRLEVQVKDAADGSLIETVSCAVQAGKVYDAIITHKGFADPDMAMFCQQVEGS